jgi:uncharacterized protein
MSSDFWAALALLLIFEGLVLFAFPSAWKKMAAQLLREEDKTLQRWGGSILIVGLVVFYLVRGSGL